MIEERAARLLNVSMFMPLGALVLGLFAWSTVGRFGNVWAIYRSLTVRQQREVDLFLGNVALLASGVFWAVIALNRWRSHRSS